MYRLPQKIFFGDQCSYTNMIIKQVTWISYLSIDADKLLEHDLGALNMAAYNRRMERANLLRSLGPCCKALCARRDIAIRRQLLKNDKVLLWSLITGTSFV